MSEACRIIISQEPPRRSLVSRLIGRQEYFPVS